MLVIRFFSRLPLWFLYMLGEILAFLAFYVFRYRRSVVSGNLKLAFPAMSGRERRKAEVGFYRQFMQVFAENIKAYRFTQADWQKRLVISNPEMVLGYLDKGISVVLMSGHTANWEWPAHSISQQLNYPMEFLYKPVKDKKFDDIMLALRTRHGGRPVSKDNAVREIIKRRKQPRLIGIIGDQLPSMGTEKYWYPFLNQETAFYKGAERIATMVGYAVFYVDTERVKRGHYQVTCRLISEPPYQKGEAGIIKDFTTKLQASVQRDPSAYLWSHKRWKYSKDEEEAVLAQASS